MSDLTFTSMLKVYVSDSMPVCVCAHECVDVYACVCVCKQYLMYQWIDLIFQWSCVALSGP